METYNTLKEYLIRITNYLKIKDYVEISGATLRIFFNDRSENIENYFIKFKQPLALNTADYSIKILQYHQIRFYPAEFILFNNGSAMVLTDKNYVFILPDINQFWKYIKFKNNKYKILTWKEVFEKLPACRFCTFYANKNNIFDNVNGYKPINLKEIFLDSWVTSENYFIPIAANNPEIFLLIEGKKNMELQIFPIISK